MIQEELGLLQYFACYKLVFENIIFGEVFSVCTGFKLNNWDKH